MYQRFEYAIGHWLSKAAEHVTGSVLCCPGCFSLVRVTALIKVLGKYRANPEEPIEYLQYDQGKIVLTFTRMPYFISKYKANYIHLLYAYK